MCFVHHGRNTGAGGVSRLAKHACPDGVRERHYKIFLRARYARTLGNGKSISYSALTTIGIAL